MLQRACRALRRVGGIFLEKQIPRTAAAMAYYLTMSLFPLIICLYALLGRNYDKMLEILEMADTFVSVESTRYLKSFLLYIANNPSRGMLTAALLLLLSSASAAVRVMQREMREIRGGGESGKGLRDWLLSLLFSLAFLAALYFGILVMLTGKTFLELVERAVPVLPVSMAWTWLRFPVLGGLVFLTLMGMYLMSGLGERSRGRTAPGALAATAGIVLMSGVFSGFIAVSARYPLVYGSLASIILLMFWLFLSGEMIFLGAAVNQTIREHRERKENETETGKP